MGHLRTYDRRVLFLTRVFEFSGSFLCASPIYAPLHKPAASSGAYRLPILFRNMAGNSVPGLFFLSQ